MAYPVHDVTLPSALTGQDNGKLSISILATIPGQGGGPAVTLLANTSMRSFKAMAAGALAAGGWLLVMTSRYDSYRPLSVQQAVHDIRYDDQPTGNTRQVCDGVSYWLKTNPATGHPYATAACPGHSNHGYAIAGDIAQWFGGGIVSIRADCMAWLQAHAVSYGWSWEFTTVPQPEPWHMRHFTGDALTPAVLAYEQGAGMAITDAEIAKIAAASAAASADSVWTKVIGSDSLGSKPASEFLKQGQLAKMEATASKDAVNTTGAATQTHLDEIEHKVDLILAALAQGGGSSPGAAPSVDEIAAELGQRLLTNPS